MVRSARGIDLSRTEVHKCILKSLKYTRTLTAEAFQIKDHEYWIKFREINSISEAYKVVGYELYIEFHDSVQTEIDLKGYTVKDMDGNFWGKVETVEKNVLNPILKTVLNGREILIPFVSPVIVEKDDRKKIVLIDPPEGLMDLNVLK